MHICVTICKIQIPFVVDMHMFVSKRLHRISFSQFVFVVFPHLGGGGIIGAGQFRDPQFFLLRIFKYCPALQNDKNLEGKSGRLSSD